MTDILIVDDSSADAARISTVLAQEGFGVAVCRSGAEAIPLLSGDGKQYRAVLILWDLPGPISGLDLLIRFERLWSEVPLAVMSKTLDASMAARALALGARDFLEKPLDSGRIRSSLTALLVDQDPWSPTVVELRRRIIGESPVLLSILRQTALAAAHPSSRILIVGESGTGKELLAKAIHQLGPRADKPWVAVNIAAVPNTLLESALFGHEKGAFTGATERHIGFFEEARDGTIFLDEIADLDLSVQNRLLRIIQENEFRRLKGTRTIPFHARILSATNSDLATAVNKGKFRRDLFHRLTDITLRVPPLRERNGDLDLLLNHFLHRYSADRQITFARETWTLLRKYPFFGNIRELENIVKGALIVCDGETILPRHLPLQNMATLQAGGATNSQETSSNEQGSEQKAEFIALIHELVEALPDNWEAMPYHLALSSYVRAFDRVYLKDRLGYWRYNVTQAARAAGVDPKTFRKRWKDCGLPPLDEKP